MDSMKHHPKPVLILQLRPEDEAADNEYQAILKYGQLRPEDAHRIRVERTAIGELDLEAFSAIIVGGSPFDISTPEDEKSVTQRRIEGDFRRLFDIIIQEDRPFLGACSGAGLLGCYLGTTISGRYAEPVGCIRVRVTEAGSKDPLLQGLPEQFEVLCGHKEACDQLPQGTTLLVTGAACPIQMYRVGANVYATQFHPEGDGPGFTTRIEAYKHHGYFPPEKAEALVVAVTETDTPHGREILRRFVERYHR